MKKSKLLLLCTCVILLSSTVHASTLGTLYYWASDASKVAAWDKSVDVYYESLNSNFESEMETAMSEGIDEWNDIGIDIEETNNGAYGILIAEIIGYGGTLYQLQEIEPSFSSGYAGLADLTDVDKDLQGTYNLYGIPSTVSFVHFTDGAAKVYVRDMPISDIDCFINTATHELGHALGYYGHFTQSGAVMNSSNDGYPTSLVSAESNHLSQVY
jgi:hypothetical protein